MTFSEELIEGAREQARLIDGLLASGDVDNDLNADEQERAELTMRFSCIAAEAMNALNTMEREAEARRKWEERQKGTARGAIIKALDPETRDKLYHMADAWKATPAAALDESINVLYSLMKMTGGIKAKGPSGALDWTAPPDWDTEIEPQTAENTWTPGGWNFRAMETEGIINPWSVINRLSLDMNGDTEIVKAMARENPHPELYGPGEGDGDEFIIAAAAEDTKDKSRTAYIIFVSTGTGNGKRGFWHKETPESMEPCIYAPPAILDILTPANSPDARKWREEAWSYYNHEGEQEERKWFEIVP